MKSLFSILESSFDSRSKSTLLFV